jgi:hypothetical protein
MSWSLALDSFVIILLAITIGCTFALHRRLGRLREDRAALEAVVESFIKATARSDESIAKLKIATDGLQHSIAKAEDLGSDLGFLIERGSSAADRLEAAIRSTRRQSEAAADKVSPPPSGRPQSKGMARQSAAYLSQAERELVSSLAANR